MAPDETDYRLPRSVVPRRYDLQLAPDLEKASFTGTVRIEVDVVEATDQIVMNAAELEVTEAALATGWVSRQAPKPSAEINLDPADERVAIVFDETIAPGPYTITCAFKGELNDKLRGFYRSRFLDDEGNEHLIATTQFESTDARRAFPCFDEPDRKAVFGVTLDVPEEMLAVSNGAEVERTKLEDGRVRIRFGDTIAMSTYLVAFVVGPLEATDPVDVDGVALRVVHAPGKAHLTAPAIEVATHALRYFAGYFDIAYPGDKIDLVAVPDFAAGAMENLGCITFRDAILLADPEATAQAEMERLAEVVEHELAHMWFGDLVTMGWWNGLWLNEAFATFMSLRCQDDFRPEWKCFVAFARSKSAALAVDGLHTTRPIEFPVRAPEESGAMFDVLTYEKGAGVLWMIEQFLGEDRFRDGVRRYLKAHAYGNTETSDLWDAIEAEAGEFPIRRVMDSWIFQGGYPLVHVSRPDSTHVEISQEPFSYLPTSDVNDSAIGSGWLVPLRLATVGESGEPAPQLLESDRVSLEHQGAALVANAGGSGFYRCAYDADLRSELVERLSDLGALERYNLLADTWAGVLSLRTGLGELGDLLARLEHESDPHVWSIVIGVLGLLDLVVAPSDRPALERGTRAVLRTPFERIGWKAVEGEDDQVPLLRSSLIAALGTIGSDPEVLEIARARFAADHGGGDPIEADLASAVLAVVAAHATRPEYEAILARQRKPQSPLDENRHLGALGSLTDPAFTDAVQKLALTEIRSQNAPYLLGSLLRNRSAGPATWDFVTRNYDALVERFPESSIHRMLEGVVSLIDLDEGGEARQLESVRTFVGKRVVGGRRRLVEQSLERLEINVRFARAARPQLAGWLAALIDQLATTP